MVNSVRQLQHQPNTSQESRLTMHFVLFIRSDLIGSHPSANHSTMSTLIVDFPAQTRRRATSRSKPTKEKAVHFSNKSDVRLYERPDKVYANELHYSRDDISQFKKSNRQAVLDMHVKHLSLVNGTEVDARVVFQGCELTGIENLLTPGLVKRTMACKRGCWNAVLDEQERQDASGCHDPDRIAHAAHEYSRRTARRSLKIGLMHHVSVQT